MVESKRIKTLRGSLIRDIPKFPNNRETKEAMESMPLGTLLVHYLNWISRYVANKPRAVVVEPSVKKDVRWKHLNSAIEGFFEKVRSGEDLTPYLSLRVHSKGYNLESSKTGPDVNRWSDKDLILNAMGFHHFHLGDGREIRGHVQRTSEVLFAAVTRDKFTALGIFDHSVFNFSVDKMTDERSKLWKLFDSFRTGTLPPGTLVVSSPITSSGHPIHVVQTAGLYAREINQIDLRLDQREYIERFYDKVDLKPPVNAKFEWKLEYSDLVLYEKELGHSFVVRQGFN
ncbi:hypothetical protein [Paraburkholderia rhizosphaerae]|uniref:Uncharacterized protein n=1 Tax=Paraburkholderia rhizosphaerae TaxID=480658 RepID=A0A4R8LX12_9BURK|nr:hypothetical protein [Paraburkholderia rhizosphaerae]TDY52720.1 hypothetical protein BX592_1042 [Paraburkholderia rhizosphaerae]